MLQPIQQLVSVLSILSFCMSFSGSFIHFIKMNEVLDFSEQQLVILKSFAEVCGYASRIIIGFVSDYIRKRKPFLIIGYVPVVILKIITIFVFLPRISLSTRTIIFIACDIIDYSLNSARDIARDCLIADAVGINNISQLSQSLNIRKSISLLGTTTGLIFFTTYYWFFPSNNAYIVLNILAILMATLGVTMLITQVQEYSQSMSERAPSFSVNLLTMFNKDLCIGFLSLFLISASKPPQIALFKVSGSVIVNTFGSLSQYKSILQCIILPVLYYICGALISWYNSKISLRKSLFIFSFLGLCICAIHIFFANCFQNIWSIIGLAILYGLYNSVVESISVAIISKTAQEKNITEKGSVLSISSVVMGLANVMIMTVVSKSNVNIFTIIRYASIFNILGLLLLLYTTPSTE